MQRADRLQPGDGRLRSLEPVDVRGLSALDLVELTGSAPHAHVVVWISGEDILLIRRVRRGRVYYLAPGVEVGEAETPGVAAGRAARTLLGIEGAVGKVLHAQVFAGVDHFFFAARALSEFDDCIALPESDDFELDGELDGTFELARLPATTLLAYDVRPWALARSVASAARALSHRDSSI